MQSSRSVDSNNLNKVALTPVEPKVSKDKREREKRVEGVVQEAIKKPPEKRERKAMAPIKEHYLPMQGTIYLDYIKNGVKTHEGRVNRPVTKAMKVGDRLALRDERAGRGIKCDIVSRDDYASFREMLVAKGVLNMLPQLTEFSKKHTQDELLNEGVRVYEAFPLSDQVTKLGCAAIGVLFLEEY